MASVLLGFEEKTGSGNESIDMLNGKFTVTRIFQGPYTERIAFVKTFLNQTAQGTIFGGTVRFPFQQHPKHKGLYAVSAEIKGHLGADKTVIEDTSIFEYKTAVVTIKYQALPFKQPENEEPSNDNEEKPLIDFVEETSDASLEFLQIPGKDVFCDGKAQHLNGPFNKIVVFLNINIRQPFVATPHWDQIMSNLGKINSGLFFTPSGKVAVKGTVRYDGPSDRIKIDALGPRNFLWDMSHKFVYNRIGWDKVWCDGEFVKPDNPLFEDANLMGVFFGPEGGPNQDDLDKIQAAQEVVDELEADRGIESEFSEEELRVAVAARNKLITNMGGTLLDQQDELKD